MERCDAYKTGALARGALEAYDPTASDPIELKRLLTYSKKFARSLTVTQLPARPRAPGGPPFVHPPTRPQPSCH